MKLWSKFAPGVWCETVGAPSHDGWVPAFAHDGSERMGPNGEPYYVLIKPEEWSESELVPAPPSVPALAYLVIHGKDPALWKATFAATEREAVAFLDDNGGFGYVPIAIGTTQMIPA